MAKSNRIRTLPLAAFCGALVCTSPAHAIVITSGTPSQAAVSGTTAGVLSYGQLYDNVNFGGVVDIVSEIGGQFFGCTGSLLTNGTSILTAGHCVLNENGVPASNVTVSFLGPGGQISDPISSYQIDPGFNGTNSTSGADLAVLTLSVPPPAFAVEYNLYTGSIPIGTPLVIAGAGYGGTAATGACGGPGTNPPSTCGADSYPFGTLRVGTNEYETDGAAFDWSTSLLIGQFYEGGTGVCTDNPNNPYSNGTTDALCANNPYHASDEVDISPGDSGGPSFFDDEIVGVHDLGVCLIISDTNSGCEEPPAVCGAPTSVGCSNDSYYGEIFADTSVADNLGFIDEATGLPEPGTGALLAYALIAAAGFRLRKRRGRIGPAASATRPALS